ncbi:hypothetical protein LMJF_34_0380 [Leishmania major strain Friedlin]|uniref:Uncharacterized protein n=1 Tax=Leishmania major TaxID=5664 RepID=Q4Q3H0_LEIMA|nr:hypothetical protein LMJF_34_0380 [Leishmania major strain Friedlin]CAG9581779.1 hypothetical_protein_-_conserved [Leishmania major strain Friedlin]CAJ07739.1 hypothetical protein LMJF_34_0380 [Leishmania major strain Friedlin]|eukprot:XP_001686128.1 hypothetical protein LMJF_34_0380 [Leishmania major strain Friedlin]
MCRSPSRPVRLAPLSLMMLILLACASVLPRAIAQSVVDPDAGADANGRNNPASASAVAGEHVTVFMCADSGDFSGAHELGSLMRAMEETQVLSLKYCQTAHLGYIRRADGHAVRSLVVTTGINYISSTLCTRSVLKLRRQRGYAYDAMVFIGTSSFSPMVGGWDPTNTSSYAASKASEQEAMMKGEAATAGVNAAPPALLFKTLQQVREEQAEEARLRQAAVDGGQLFALSTASQLNFENARTGEQVDWDGCSPRVPTAITPLSLGSVCVTSTAYLMETGSCTERVRHSQCSRPHCTSFRSELGSVTKVFFASDALARKIEAASHHKAWPEMPEIVKKGQMRFWAANEAVEPVGEGAERHRAAPSGPSFVTCAEATGNTINTGAERDYLCREHTTQALDMAQHRLAERQDGKEAPQEPPLTTQNVTCVRAMESMGFLHSVAEDSTARDIPVAVVRGASDYNMYPMKKVYVPPAVWRSALAAGQLKVSPRVVAALKAEEAAAADGEDALRKSAIAAYTWHQDAHFMSEAEHQAFVNASFHYAVETATFVLSNYFFGGRSFASASGARHARSTE